MSRLTLGTVAIDAVFLSLFGSKLLGALTGRAKS